MEAFSPNNRLKTIILLALGMLCAVGAILLGIEDSFPGVLMAHLAAIAVVVAFVHPWRSPRKFLYLTLAAVLGFILFILIDIAAQNPTASPAFRELMDSPAFEIISTIIALLCPVALIIGIVGWIVMVIRRRRQVH